MRNLFNKVVSILILVLAFGYTGVLRQEQLFLFAVSFVVLILGFVCGMYRIRKPKMIFVTLGLLLIFNVMFTHPTVGYKYLLYFFTGSILYLFVWTKEDIKSIINLFSYITLIFLLFTFANYFYPDLIINIFGRIMTTEQIETFRFGQTWGVPGLPGELSFNAFILSIGFGERLNNFYLKAEKWHRIQAIFSCSLFLVGIILSGKRSALLLLPFISLAIILPRLLIKSSFFNVFVLFSGITMVPLIVFGFFMDRIESLVLSGKGTSPLSNRELYWNIAIDMIRESPFFGHGLNGYDLRFNTLRNHAGFAGAHNSFLQFMAELGIVGSAIYFLFIIFNLSISISFYINSTRYKRTDEAFISGLSVFVQLLCIGIGVSESIFYQPQQLFMYLLCSGFCFALQIRMKGKRI